MTAVTSWVSSARATVRLGQAIVPAPLGQGFDKEERRVKRQRPLVHARCGHRCVLISATAAAAKDPDGAERRAPGSQV
jgi:hypothetical protein